jgi:drug/metabolite transporter (DMT)-like permease
MVLILADPATGGQWPGVALTLIAIGCCAAYSIIARRYAGASDATAPVVLAQQVYALAFAAAVGLVAAVLAGGSGGATVTPLGLLSAVTSGVLYYAAAYWFYLSALRTVPASLAASSFYLIPVFGVAAGSLMLGDRLEPAQWIGVAIVAAAVASIALGGGRVSASTPEVAARA